MPEVKGIKCILLDIEGTICPISFVKDTLFPYALKALPDVLASQWDEDEFKPYRDAFPESAQGSPEALQAHVEDLTKHDVKVAYLKNLQGHLWENGYRTGAYATPLFPDIAPRLKQWKDDGFELAIYSSGSVFAQKLLFGHVKTEVPVTGQKRARSSESEEEESARDGTEPPIKRRTTLAEHGDVQKSEVEAASTLRIDKSAKGENDTDTADKESKAIFNHSDHSTTDLRYLISSWFDTTNAGVKSDQKSYEKIATTLEWPLENMLFLSDNITEVDAAVAAGMRSFIVDRPGNAPLSEVDKNRVFIIDSFDQILLVPSVANGRA